MTSLSSVRRAGTALVFSTALFAPSFAGADALSLINGWKNYGNGTAKAAVTQAHGIVRFKGAIADGSNDHPFTMPFELRPAAEVYVPVDMCGASNGRLHIFPTGEVVVEAERLFSNAQCFTSLDGAHYALSSAGYKNLKLRHGWSEYSNDDVAASAHNVGGVVHLASSIQTEGSSNNPIVLPAALRPAARVYVKADMCSAANGRLDILTDGTVFVETFDFADAQCFTSLDGASYALNGNGYTPLGLIGGWANYGGGTAAAAVAVSGKLVQFRGAIKASAGADSHPFVLPVGFRPAKLVYVPVDMCDATNGRLVIDPNGSVTVQAESDTTKAQCFTSLDGVSFLK